MDRASRYVGRPSVIFMITIPGTPFRNMGFSPDPNSVYGCAGADERTQAHLLPAYDFDGRHYAVRLWESLGLLPLLDPSLQWRQFLSIRGGTDTGRTRLGPADPYNRPNAAFHRESRRMGTWV